RIVNLSSGVATRAVPGMGDYGTSKAALRMAGMTLAAELTSPDRPGGPRGRAAVLSYEPGVVDTEMQVRARSAPREEAPWNQMFVDFHAKGALQPAVAVVSDVTGFLAGNTREPFTEKRFSAR
ncbi:MAG: SDR family NAD(P)-dependent oxidoreductase, partial [Gemmatimonadetes bacterium]|nr:SDR family NAD(P)-dependent oxidoreductase [Gemmatimonadota bacterium]